MLPQVIDSPRPTASPRALPVGAAGGMGTPASPHGSCTHGCWLRSPGVGGEGLAGARSAHPQEATGELAAVQRALEKGHWKKD